MILLNYVIGYLFFYDYKKFQYTKKQITQPLAWLDKPIPLEYFKKALCYSIIITITFSRHTPGNKIYVFLFLIQIHCKHTEYLCRNEKSKTDLSVLGDLLSPSERLVKQYI